MRRLTPSPRFDVWVTCMLQPACLLGPHCILRALPQIPILLRPCSNISWPHIALTDLREVKQRPRWRARTNRCWCESVLVLMNPLVRGWRPAGEYA